MYTCVYVHRHKSRCMMCVFVHCDILLAYARVTVCMYVLQGYDDDKRATGMGVTCNSPLVDFFAFCAYTKKRFFVDLHD